jgi:hypothetical protein
MYSYPFSSLWQSAQLLLRIFKARASSPRTLCASVVDIVETEIAKRKSPLVTERAIDRSRGRRGIGIFWLLILNGGVISCSDEKGIAQDEMMI